MGSFGLGTAIGVAVLVNMSLEASNGWRPVWLIFWETAAAVSSAVLTPSGGVMETADGAMVAKFLVADYNFKIKVWLLIK
jgi:hypothetical protein